MDDSGGIFGLVVFGLIVWWAWGNFSKPDYSKPWWTGREIVKACKVPYYSVNSCYTLPVDSNGEEITRLNFNNGGYFEIYNSECHEAASSYNYKQFCTFIDNDGTRWDFLPAYALD